MTEKFKYPSGENLKQFLGDYADTFRQAITAVPQETLEAFHRAIDSAVQSGKRVYVAGNGGSAAIADHLCCDFTKGTHHPSHKTVKTHSLASNTALLTALANDFSYEQSFSRQLEYLGEKGDVVILVSSSGNSPNILEAAKVAKKLGITVLGMVGFAGGALKGLSDVALHIEVANYGIVEDAHQALMHVFAQWMMKFRENKTY